MLICGFLKNVDDFLNYFITMKRNKRQTKKENICFVVNLFYFSTGSSLD